MFYRNNGTTPDGAPVSKRRYRIANTQINLVHYLPANVGSDCTLRSHLPLDLDC